MWHFSTFNGLKWKIFPLIWPDFARTWLSLIWSPNCTLNLTKVVLCKVKVIKGEYPQLISYNRMHVALYAQEKIVSGNRTEHKEIEVQKWSTTSRKGAPYNKGKLSKLSFVMNHILWWSEVPAFIINLRFQRIGIHSRKFSTFWHSENMVEKSFTNCRSSNFLCKRTHLILRNKYSSEAGFSFLVSLLTCRRARKNFTFSRNLMVSRKWFLTAGKPFRKATSW